MTSLEMRTGTTPRAGLAVFAVITLALLAGGYSYYLAEADEISEEKYQAIAAICELKSGQIQQWRQARLGDATVVAMNPFVSKAVSESSGDAFAPVLRTALREYLKTIALNYGYSDILLLSPDGNLLVSFKDASQPLNPATQRAFVASLTGREAVLSDFFRGSGDIIHIDAVGVLRDAGGKPLAVAILRSDADTYLFPLIQSWPTPSRSSETLLVLREGNELVFLNELRHRSKTALSLREPLTLTNLPAVQAVLGRLGRFEGKDYRGFAVLADLRPIPGSPWFMVAKVDADEILAEARYRAGAIALIVGAFILLAAAAVIYGYQQRQVRVVKELYESERKQREAREVFRTTLYSIGDAVITTDEDGLVRQMNREAERLTGWLEADAGGKPIEEIFRIVNEYSRASVESPAHRVLREGIVVGLANHTLLIARDGTEHPIADSGSPIRKENGAILGVVLVFRDQTEQREAEEALRESERNFKAAFEGSHDGITITSEEGKVLDCNRRALELFGLERKEDFGNARPADFSPPFQPDGRKSIDASRERIREAIEKSGFVRFEWVHRRKSGETFPAEIIMTSYRLGENIVLQTSIRDITDRKRAEAEREKLEAQLFQAQKMEAVGRLAGGVAHDFNNMLSIINGYSDMALDALQTSDPLYDEIQEIKNAGRRSADLVRQLLAFARKQTIAPEILDLNDTVSGMLKMLQRLIGENIHLLWKPAANLWPVKMDPVQIDQILANLVVNARDAISGVGKVIIETGKVEFDAAWCQDHAGFAPGEYVLLAVSDDGCGMDKETLGKLFEPFFTTKPQGQGTGLGLATVYGIVKQNHGFIDVYSEPGKGATFKIYLPRQAPDERVIEKPRKHADPLTGTETVLLVEDETALLKLTRSILQRQGYTVLSAKTPTEALSLAEKHPGGIHLLLTDVVMPEMNGRQLMEILHAVHPEMKSLFMSGYTADVIAHHGVLDQGLRFIQKPFAIKDLARKVREVLDQRRRSPEP
jgi:PAS domain S-box-containing protein